MPQKRRKKSSNYSKYKKKFAAAAGNAQRPDASLPDSEATLEYTCERQYASVALYLWASAGFLVAALATNFTPLLGGCGFTAFAYVVLLWRSLKGVQKVRINREGLLLSFRKKEPVFYPHKGHQFTVIPGPTGVGKGVAYIGCVQVLPPKSACIDYDISHQDAHALYNAIWSRGNRVEHNYLFYAHSIWPSCITKR